jgi:PKD repeat protein
MMKTHNKNNKLIVSHKKHFIMGVRFSVAILALVMICISILSFSIEKAKATILPPSVAWEKGFDPNTNTDSFTRGIQTSDGGYVMVGRYNCSGFPPTCMAWALKTDISGNFVWQQTYSAYQFSDIIQASDGSYVVSGGKTNDALLVRLNSSGNVIWEKTYNIIETEWFSSIKQTGDGGFIMAGSVSTSTPYPNQDGLLLKTDASGNELWHKTFGNPNLPGPPLNSFNDYFSTILITVDGGYLAVGSKTLTYTPVDMDGWFVKTDINGSLQWEKTYAGNTVADWLTDAKKTPDGGYIASGRVFPTQSDGWLIKTDGSGVLVWSKVFGDASTGQDYLYGVDVDVDGGYIAVGIKNWVTVGAVAIKYDINGSLQWEKTLGQKNGQFNSITKTSDGGFIAIGANGVTTTAGYLVKFLSINRPPVVSFTATPNSGSTPLSVNLFDTSTDPDGDAIFGRVWNFGGGSCTSNCGGINPVVVFNSAGSYIISLTVQDSKGAFSAPTTKTITVTNPIINGGWSAWSAWGTCTGVCGTNAATQTRTRACNNPTPANGGADCVGSTTESQVCTASLCPATININIVRPSGMPANAGGYYGYLNGSFLWGLDSNYSITGQYSGTWKIDPYVVSGYYSAIVSSTCSPIACSSASVQYVGGGQTINFTVTYTAMPGTIKVNSNLANTIVTVGSYGGNVVTANTPVNATTTAPVGSYTAICPNKTVLGYNVTQPVAQNLSAGGTITFTCTYTLIPTASRLSFSPKVTRGDRVISGSGNPITILPSAIDPINTVEICTTPYDKNNPTDPKACSNPVRIGDVVDITAFLVLAGTGGDPFLGVSASYTSACKLVDPVTNITLNEDCNGESNRTKSGVGDGIGRKFNFNLSQSGKMSIKITGMDGLGLVVTKTIIIRVPAIATLQ